MKINAMMWFNDTKYLANIEMLGIHDFGSGSYDSIVVKNTLVGLSTWEICSAEV